MKDQVSTLLQIIGLKELRIYHLEAEISRLKSENNELKKQEKTNERNMAD